uniref:Uncharacterized protein n=1 Tax=Arundo donax TaxID=35708 RepID=A0A0A9DZP6_ARUDO
MQNKIRNTKLAHYQVRETNEHNQTDQFINLLICEQVNQWAFELFLCDQIQSNREGGTVYREVIILILSSPVKRAASPCTSYGSIAKEFPSFPGIGLSR